MSKDLFTHLILKRFQGTITPEESAQLDRWLAEDASRQNLLEHLRASWERADSYKSDFQLDLDRGWQQIQGRIQQPSAPAKVVPMRWRPIMRIAASVVVLAGLAWAAVTLWLPGAGGPQMATIITAEDEVREIALPDGSMVWLAGNSKLTYPEAFKKRDVALLGEAEFHVEHDARHPFRVSAAGTSTTVLGTEFHVAARNSLVSVALRSGKVAFRAPKGGEVVLAPGQRAQYDPATGEVTTAEENLANFDAWRTGELVFDAQPIAAVVADLERYFGITIRLINQSGTDCPFTGRFKNPELNEILDVLAFTFELSRTEENGVTVLTVASCE